MRPCEGRGGGFDSPRTPFFESGLREEQEQQMEFDSVLRRIRFSISHLTGDREHYVNADDIRTVLVRLPLELWAKLRAVHFNDQSRGARTLGYVARGYREIAICALPPRISLTRMLEFGSGSKGRKRTSPTEFGAVRGMQWPRVAVRRFLLYDVFLHELGHLQVVEEDAVDPSRRYAKERKAQDFADYWRRELWSRPFEHPAPEHRPPSAQEVEALTRKSD
jgi:hypothetical protein